MAFYVTVTGTLPGVPAEGFEAPFVTFTPEGWVADPADSLLFPPSPQQLQTTDGMFAVPLLATDTTNTGWTWQVRIEGIDRVPPWCSSFALPSNAAPFTATSASPAVFTASGTSYEAGQPVTLAGDTLPGDFTAQVIYYVTSPSGGLFSLAATPGGAVLASTSSGSGWVIPVEDISTLAQVPPLAPTAEFLPLPSGGPPNSGDVPTAVRNGAAWSLDWQASSGADKTYTQPFGAASTVIVPHHLGKYPAVTVMDSAGDECQGDVEFTDLETLTVTFSAPFSGTVTCN